MNKENGFSQMTAVAVIVGILIVVGVVWAVMASDKSNEPQEAMMEDNATVPPDSMMENKTESGEAMMQKSGAYKDYSTATVQAEQAQGNKVVLFFHATWCPFCKAADAEFKSRASDIPAGVTVLKTDYDSNTDLKQKYGVTYQHTFVQIDTNGNQVSKWNGGDIDNLKKYVK